MRIESNRELSPAEHEKIAIRLEHMALGTDGGAIFMDDPSLLSKSREVLVGELHRLASHHRALAQKLKEKP